MNLLDNCVAMQPPTVPCQEGGELMTSVTVPETVVARWEDAYRAYINIANSRAETRRERLELADVLQNVANAWRDIATTPGLDWWQLAALSAAVETAEQQARQFRTPRPWTAQPHIGPIGDR